MYIAHLVNWTGEDRRENNAYIRIMDTNNNTWGDPATVRCGQSARSALEAAGWKVASGVLKNKGQVAVRVDRLSRPGLADAQRRVDTLLKNAGL